MKLLKALESRRIVLFILMIAIISGISPTVHMQSIWHHDMVAEGLLINQMSPRSQAADSMGYPHIAFGARKLYHAWFDGSQWQIEVVDESAYTGSQATMVIDSMDHVHIGYLNESNEAIKYAVRMPGGWSIETVPVTKRTQSTFGMAVDDQDNVAFIIDHFETKSLAMYHKTSTGWSQKVVHNYSASLSSIALTFNGAEPRIVFGEGIYGSFDVKIRYKSGSSWSTAFLDSSGDGGYCITVCNFSTTDVTSVAYLDQNNDQVKFVQFQPGGPPIMPEIIADIGSDSSYASLVTSSDGKPMIAYFNSLNNGLYYAMRPSTTWLYEKIPVTGKPSHYISISVDTSELPQISYVDSDDYTLCHVRFNGSNWTRTEVETIRTFFGHAKIAVDTAGTPWVIYGDNTRHKLYIRRWTGTEWSETGGADSQKLRQVSSMAMDTSGRPHVVVQTDAGIIRYGVYTRSGWQFSDLDNPNLEISGNILVLDSQDQPWILCYDNSECSMTIARKNGSSWEYRNLFRGKFIYSHLCIDSQDQLMIACESYFNRISYLIKEGNSWSEDIVDDCNQSGFGCSMVLDGNDKPYIVYYCGDETEVKCAFLDNGSWTAETVATETIIESTLSISLDMAGEPKVFFSDAVSSQLKVAMRLPSGWAVQTVNPEVEMPYGVSSATDHLGRLMVSYTNGTTGNVRFSFLDEPIYYVLTMYPLMLETGDNFYLHRHITNTTTVDVPCTEYLLLDVYGEFWYGPLWTQEVDAESFVVDAWMVSDWTVFDFPWPAITGSATGIRFWGGIVDGAGNLLDYDMVEFGWKQG